MANEQYLSFLRDPDQATRRAELAAFIGPNADAYLRVYDTLYATANRTPDGKPKFSLTANGFNAGAFFGGPVWFFYRRMWGWAWAYVGVLVLLGLIPGRVGLPVSVVLGLTVNQWYVHWSIGKIQKLREQGADAAQLVAAGGVSVVAAWISGAILVALAAIGIASLFLIGGR